MFDGLSTKIVASTDFSLQKHRNIALAYHNGTTVRFSYFGLKNPTSENGRGQNGFVIV